MENMTEFLKTFNRALSQNPKTRHLLGRLQIEFSFLDQDKIYGDIDRKLITNCRNNGEVVFNTHLLEDKPNLKLYPVVCVVANDIENHSSRNLPLVIRPMDLEKSALSGPKFLKRFDNKDIYKTPDLFTRNYGFEFTKTRYGATLTAMDDMITAGHTGTCPENVLEIFKALVTAADLKVKQREREAAALEK